MALARHEDPTHSDTLSIKQIDTFYELREKYGPLGKINVRVFFSLHRPTRTIVILGAIKKENEGATYAGDKIRMRRRKRLYETGDFSTSG